MMKDGIRRIAHAFWNTKFSRRLGLLVIILIIAVPLIAYAALNPQMLWFGHVGVGTGTPTYSPSSLLTQTPLPTSTYQAKGCGVTRSTDGTYHFSWLHVDSQGNVVDVNNCVVRLLGWNGVGAFLGNAGNIGSGLGETLIHINVVRVAFNSRWYISDVYVPDQRMHYKAWLQKIVATLESRGNYVILDANTAFFEPPCGNDEQGTNITFCPSEDQGRKDFSNPNSPYYQNVGGLELYQPIAIQALTDLAQLYANDPAVLFDVWNEPGNYIFILPGSIKSRADDMNQRIDSVRRNDPRALVIVFAESIKEDLNYTQSNLVFDFHVYPNFSGISPVTHSACSTSGTDSTKLLSHIRALRNTGKAILIGEWGHCYDIPSYNQQIFSIAKTYNAALAYFFDEELMSGPKGGKYLNANGVFVQQDYNSLFG